MAYVLLCALRRIGLAHTQFARASCGTIRLKLLKIGALVRTSVRRIKLALDFGDEPFVLCQPEQEVDAVGLAPGHQVVAREA